MTFQLKYTCIEKTLAELTRSLFSRRLRVLEITTWLRVAGTSCVVTQEFPLVNTQPPAVPSYIQQCVAQWP